MGGAAAAGQRQGLGRELHRGLVRIRSRSPAKGDRAQRIGRGGGAHGIDESESGLGELTHDGGGYGRLRAASSAIAPCALAKGDAAH